MRRFLLALTILCGAAGASATAQAGNSRDVPNRVAAPAVVYPKTAAAAGVRGPVVGRLSIDRRGLVSRVEPLSGDPRLVDSGKAAMARWRFAPGTTSPLIAAVNVAPADPAAAPTVLPTPLVARVGQPATSGPGTPGRATMRLTVHASGRVIDAIGIGGKEDVLVEALDSALRWTTEPLANADAAALFACRSEWLTGSVASLAPPRDTLVKSDPRFSDEARAAATSVPVILELALRSDGIVQGVKVLRSNPSLDEEAMRTVRGWRFSPLFLGGTAIPTIIVVTIPPPRRSLTTASSPARPGNLRD